MTKCDSKNVECCMLTVASAAHKFFQNTKVPRLEPCGTPKTKNCTFFFISCNWKQCKQWMSLKKIFKKAVLDVELILQFARRLCSLCFIDVTRDSIHGLAIQLPEHIPQPCHSRVFHHTLRTKLLLKIYISHHSSIYNVLLPFKTRCHNG